MIKVISIVGARPQFVKASVISREIAHHKNIKEVIIHTGQHFDKNMSDIFFDEMSIPYPDYNLNINGMSHGAMTGQMLEKIEGILIEEKPDWVLVYGDTNSTLAGALAAKKLHMKVAHIEAGLRSYNMHMPEEINRILTDRISDILFCPTSQAVKNLEDEGFKNFPVKIEQVGDIMLDAAIFYSAREKNINLNTPDKFVLCTIHRAENTDNEQRLTSIFSALEEIAKESFVVLPLHPRTKIKLKQIKYDFDNSCIQFISPVGYLEMIHLLKNCEMVITDSGGVQKEAYFFKKQCITIRDETEWVELIDAGCNVLAGANKNVIIEHYKKNKTKSFDLFDDELYGKGDAGKIIVNKILESNQ